MDRGAGDDPTGGSDAEAEGREGSPTQVGEDTASDGERGEAVENPPAPSLEAKDRQEVASDPVERPAWYDTPGTETGHFLLADPDAPLMGIHLGGPGVSDHGIEIGLFQRILDGLRKTFGPLQVLATGTIPTGNRLKQIEASPPLLSLLNSPASVTAYFALGDTERQLVERRGHDYPEIAMTLPTVRAVGHLGHLLTLDPAEAPDELEAFGRRVGRSFGGLTAALGEGRMGLDWWSDIYSDREIELPAERSRSLAERVLEDAVTTRRDLGHISGFLFEVRTASDNRRVRLESGGKSYTATYDIRLTSQVKEALSRQVIVRLEEIAYRYRFAERPHRRTYEVTSVIDIGEAGGALAEEESS